MKEYIIKVDDSKPDIMGSLPLIDKPKELVRCRDCKHFHSEVEDVLTTFFRCNESHDTWGKDWFCPDGERKEDND